MAFVFEKVPEEDWIFFKTMGLKDYIGKNFLQLNKRTTWCADRELNAYLVEIGGRFSNEYPFYCDFWWDGNIIRIDVGKRSIIDHDGGVNFVWIINRMPIPQNIWDNKDKVVEMIKEALIAKRDWCVEECLKSVSVKMNCDPIIAEV